MISVIVPTMWRYTPFVQFIGDLVAHAHVQDVIIINNCVEQTPDHIILSHPKVKMVTMGMNTYVNPAWNLGVYHSTAHILCVMNDDIVFDTLVFDTVFDLDATTDWGAAGLYACAQPGNSCYLRKWNNEQPHGFGWLFFLPRSLWCDIPANLLVYYGDNFIWDVITSQHKHMYLICNLTYHTPGSVTTSLGFRSWAPQEGYIYQHICTKYQITRTYNIQL